MNQKIGFLPALLLGGLSAVLFTGCGREKVAEKYPNGKPKVIRSYGWLGGENQGNLKREQIFYFNGNKEADTRFRGGLRHGQYHDYWHNGQKKTEGRFVQGKKEGEWDFFYNEFTVAAKGLFKGDKKEGIWHQYWENGEPKAEGAFHDGKEIGTFKEWSAKGEPTIENSCFESNDHGRYRSFHANKLVKEDYACHFGVPMGPYERKDPDGLLVEKGVFDDRGRKEGAWETVHPDGKRASLKHYHEGMETDSSYAWYANGKPKEKGFFTDGTGERLSYDSLGHLTERQHLTAGRPEGESWAYYPTGVKRSLVIYKDGLPAELHKWHPNGKAMADGMFLAGKRTGVWKQYFDNGTVAQVSTYVEGVLNGEELFYDEKGKLTRTQRYEHGYPAEGKIPAALAAGLDKPIRSKDTAAANGKAGAKPPDLKLDGIRIEDSHP